MPGHPPLAVKPWRHEGQPGRQAAGTRLDNAGPAKRGAVEAFKLNISSGGTLWQPSKDESCSEWIGEHGGACYKVWHRVAHSWFLTFVRQSISNYWGLLNFYKKYSCVRLMGPKYILCPSSPSQNMGLSENMRFVFAAYVKPARWGIYLEALFKRCLARRVNGARMSTFNVIYNTLLYI